VVVGAVVGWLIGGRDVATLRAVLDDPATMDAMTDRQVVGLFLPPIVGAVVVPWAVNRWIEHSPKHDDSPARPTARWPRLGRLRVLGRNRPSASRFLGPDAPQRRIGRQDVVGPFLDRARSRTFGT
jgi:hypothetical protein